MYSTSPSTSSMASSSGRSSPEHQPHQQPASQPQRSNSFLLPQFFFSPSNNSNTATSENASHPLTNALLAQPPRRTSFGAGFSNSGRFSALSAFGFMSSSPGLSTSPPASLAGAAELSKRSESVVGSPASEAVPSWSSSAPVQQSGASVSASPATAAAPAPPAKRHLCFPDGMGGTVCLEVKDRSRRGSAVN
ncbi:uncharacterized protein SRS1_11555 [Sporisorium reilianum f. sp. reilianum]|uniref:Uncharacterized protein n=1 Tax=Sporisorium reilianum f. sp. reilianum TaxID=72559 RepID=A0A2N8U693_9BASI|nr:uncharacterized protein SRS1_11555 [Sporisorium reilianum f. sp. reilianum]